MSQKKVRKFKKKKRSKPSGGPRKNPQPNPLELRRREKIDTPPANPGVQEVPRSLKEFIKLKELANESTKETNNRRERKPAKKENHKTTNGGIFSAQRQTTCPSEPIHSKSSERLVEVADLPERTSRPLSIKKKRKVKLEKLKMKRKLKKELRRKEVEDDEAVPEIVKDEIKFGEVVHRPPQISTLPRLVSKPGFQYRPGRADDLLVKSIMKSGENKSYKSQLCAKRKHLSVSDQRQLEVERNKAILTYRNLKMKRAKTKL